MEAKSAMDESVILKGCRHGGCAIIWNPLIQGKISPVECTHKRLCGVTMKFNNNLFLILNAYMPFDKGYDDGDTFIEYVNVMCEVKLLIDMINPTYVIYGGDFNTNFRRNSPWTHEMMHIATECNLSVCTNMDIADVPYTFIGPNSKSKIDHFLVSMNLADSVLDCSIIDNHLHSDHVPLILTLDIDLVHNATIERTYATNVSWQKASDDDISNYKNRLDKLLVDVHCDNDVFNCQNRFCTGHKDALCSVYRAYISATEYISTTAPPSVKSVPGWNEYIVSLMKESLYWHRCWKAQGSPHQGDIAEMRRITRARYHHAVRSVKKDKDKIRMTKMAQAIERNNHRDLFSEVKKIKGRGSVMPASMDNATNDDDICDVFAKKYQDLYNSVPYNEQEMTDIKHKIQQQLQNESNVNYFISVSEVIKSVSCLKKGKSDGSEGLYSDHLINASHTLYVYLSLIFNAMLIHGISPETMLLGTMVPIPKNKRLSLCDSDNYRAIALSSIIGKTLDWIILIKEEISLSSSSLQFGFKGGTSTTQSTFIMNETISYYNFNHTNVYAVFLDASKAFDHVQYCKLFNELFKRNMSPFVLRLLLNMYTNQNLLVRWGNSVSNQFTVCNGVKQGGVLSPILFAMYIDGLLVRLKESGIGCCMGNSYVGGMGYADDVKLLCPALSGI